MANKQRKSSKSSVAKRKSRKCEVILDRSNLDSSTTRKVPLKENELARSKDIMSELQTRFNIQNFGLRPHRDRILGPKPQQSISEWDKMVIEIKERAALRKTSN